MKKIDTSKSLIFDKKIDNLKAAFEYLNEEGYFSDVESFSEYKEGILNSVTMGEGIGYPYGCKGMYTNYKYFIPKNLAVFEEPEEKKYRPYKDISEFCVETGCEVLGEDFITIKNKNTQKEYTLLYVGYSNEEVQLGGYILTFADLLKNYEYALNNFEWLPFGIEE